MKRILLLSLFILIAATGCDGWVYQIPTFPAPPPTITPLIYSPTPVIVTVTNTPELPTLPPTETATEGPSTATATIFTETAAPPPTETATLRPVSPVLTVNIIGCNTSIDITHGMGEVTNAFVNIQNNTGQDFVELCTTLFALDEGRVHPDKTVCIPSLADGQQVTLKLTTDSTYKKETPIQVEVKSGDILLSRIPEESCIDIGLLAPKPEGLRTPIAIP